MGYAALVGGPYGNWGAYDEAIDVPASYFVKVELQSAVDVNSINVEILSADPDQIAAGLPTPTVDQVTKTATFQMPAVGSCYLVTTTIDYGTSSTQTSSLAAHVLNAASRRLIAVGETDEADRTNYWVPKINEAIGAGGAAGTPFGAVVYVDADNGNDTSGARGDHTKPYLTITAALAVYQSGDVMLVGPGAYTENVTIPNLATVIIQGHGRNATTIVNAGAGATIGYVSGGANALQTLVLRGMTVHNTNGSSTLIVDGTLDADLFLTGPLLLDDVKLSQAAGNATLYLIRVNQVWLRDVYTSATQFNEVAQVLARNWINNSKESIWNYNSADPEPSGKRLVHHFWDCMLGTVTCNEQSALYFHSTCMVGTFGGVLGDEAAGDYGYIRCDGETDTVDVTFDYDNVAVPIGLDFSGATINAQFTAADAGSTTNKLIALARNTKFTFPTADKIEAGSMTEFYLEGASFAQDSLKSSGGTTGEIDRDTHSQAVNLGGGGQAVTWDNAGGSVPFVSAPAAVLVELSGSAAQAGVTAKANTGCTVTPAGADAGATVTAFLRR